MGKRASSKRQGDREEGDVQERRSKARHEQGSSSLVNSRLIPLFHSMESTRFFKDKGHAKNILEGRTVKFDELEKMYAENHIDTANFLAIHGWIDFVKVRKPTYANLLKILISNLDTKSMISWIGKKKIDLSVESWCRTFNLPYITPEEENFIMTMTEEELFFRLTQERNLGIMPFIRMNQLNQDPATRLSAQIVMNVLVPKKGSKEQFKPEESRLLYAMMYSCDINLAQFIVDRLRVVVERKSTPICYGMHLVEIMERAGVNLECAGDEPKPCKSEINHHTLKRLGYKFQFNEWTFVGRGRVNDSFSGNNQGAPRREPFEGEETEGEGRPTQDTHTMPTHAESSAPSPSHPRPTHSTLHISSQLANLVTKTELAHFHNSITERLQLVQATILSKLDTMDSRLKACEEHLLPSHTPDLPTTSQPSDPKGKAPLHTSPTFTPHHTPHTSPVPSASPTHLTPHLSPSRHTSPISPPPAPVPDPPASPLSPTPSLSQFELVARTPAVPTVSPDSEATQSDPRPTSPAPPSLPPAPTASPSLHSVSYQRRKKVAVSKSPSS